MTASIDWARFPRWTAADMDVPLKAPGRAAGPSHREGQDLPP